MGEAASGFDFDFGTSSRAQLLQQAAKTVAALGSDLGDGDGAPEPTAGEAAAARLFQQLDGEVAEFGAFPEIVPMAAEHFTAAGLKTPDRFVELSKTHRFYWVRIPFTLKPMDNLPFTRLKCGIEFNPGEGAGHLRPVAQMILPDRKFQKLLESHTRLTLDIGEDFEFEAKGEGEAGGAKVAGGVDVKAAAGAGFTAGPFTYTLKKAKLDHTGSGTEKVFWSLDGAEFFEEEEPVLVVVLRLPLAVDHLSIAAALQASHEFRPLATNVGAFLELLGDRLANFFRKGAPAADKKVWDLTPRL